MYLSDRGRSVACLNLISHVFVLFRKTSYNVIDLTFVVNRLSKQGNAIKAGCKPLNILIDGLRSFRPLIELLFELLHMSTTWFSVNGRKCVRDLSGSIRGGEHGLNCTQQCIVDESILAFPGCIRWIFSDIAVGDGAITVPSR